MTCVFTAPKLSDPTAHEKQKLRVSEKIAEIIAAQLLELVKVGPEAMTRHTIPAMLVGSRAELFKKIIVLVRNDAWPIAPQSAVAEVALAPTVVELDSCGRARSQHATVQKKQVAIDTLPWPKWVELETPVPDQKFAKLLLETVVRMFHRHFMLESLPIVLFTRAKTF